MQPDASDLKARIRERALALSFDACGFASATDAWPASDRLKAFVAEGLHGDMGWMAETAERRAHPTAMWPDALSAVVLAVNYGPDRDPREAQAEPSHGAISVYAQGDDYHEVIKTRLKALARSIAAEHGCEVKVFVDTAPLMEKPLAMRAGLGWQGKHTNLLSREWGNWLFLGVVLTTLDLEPDSPGEDRCASCTACLDACPTAAFPAPYRLDARRCLSYLTIEHAGPWPDEFRAAMGNRIYGCDDCLAACPWNKFAAVAQEQAFHARDALRSPPLETLAALDDAAFRDLFRKNPIKRIGRARFVRNVLYAIGNSGDPRLAESAKALLGDADPVVRDAAEWAILHLSRLREREGPAAPAVGG